MTDKLDIKETAETAYLSTFKWDFDGLDYICNGLPESTKDKMKDIFNKWKIGFHARRGEKAFTVFVPKRQFKKVQFVPTNITFLHGATSEDL